MISLWQGITELGGDEGAKDEGWPGNLGTGVSSNKGHMRLILRTPKQEPEAVSVDEETGLLPGAQRILEFRLRSYGGQKRTQSSGTSWLLAVEEGGLGGVAFPSEHGTPSYSLNLQLERP